VFWAEIELLECLARDREKNALRSFHAVERLFRLVDGDVAHFGGGDLEWEGKKAGCKGWSTIERVERMLLSNSKTASKAYVGAAILDLPRLYNVVSSIAPLTFDADAIVTNQMVPRG
jgi:hypothetical protein